VSKMRGSTPLNTRPEQKAGPSRIDQFIRFVQHRRSISYVAALSGKARPTIFGPANGNSDSAKKTPNTDREHRALWIIPKAAAGPPPFASALSRHISLLTWAVVLGISVCRELELARMGMPA